MSKIRCLCNAVIYDQTDYLPYKGMIVPDTKEEEILDTISSNVNSLIAAVGTNTLDDWRKQNGLGLPYPQNLDGGTMMHDLFITQYIDNSKDIYQCEECGRILIQKTGSREYMFFKPESDGWQNILTV